MNLLYWDTENINNLNTEKEFPNVKFYIGHAVYAKPFHDISSRLKPNPIIIKKHQLYGYGPDVADIHLLSLLHQDILNLGKENTFYLATKDKLLTYRFVNVARSCGIKASNIKYLYTSDEVRTRSARGDELLEKKNLNNQQTN
ncbi:hypothetical protein [Pseudoalteromonas marina]|uniref:PIN-like domain-containing protein n=1 Tax=Pseudoalteromonas marina TaxID=267375 RepID=A0ABT9FGN8_9GAMM|nr:hypothetical protein [Pseudoalteromonas marina]MDP2565844.1 hypothetical protein [Pseudoalteromonas marina]